MTKDEFAEKLEALLTEYSGRVWSNWIVFGQSPGKEAKPDTIILSGICPEDLPRAFAEVTSSLHEAETVEDGAGLKSEGPTLN